MIYNYILLNFLVETIFYFPKPSRFYQYFCSSLSLKMKIKWYGFAGQFFFVHLQLLVVQGLTYDGGRSLFGKILRTKLAMFLGEVCLHLDFNISNSSNHCYPYILNPKKALPSICCYFAKLSQAPAPASAGGLS